MNPRQIKTNDPAINGVGRPVELKSPAGLLRHQEIQISINTISIPGTDEQFLAADFAAMLSVLLAGNNIVAPENMQLRRWLENNLCELTAIATLRLRKDAYKLAQTIIQDILGGDDDI